MKSDLGLVTGALAMPCTAAGHPGVAVAADPRGELPDAAAGLPEGFADQRRRLLARIAARLRAGGLGLDHDDLDRTLAAMASVPRERFLPADFAAFAYLPMSGDLGRGQATANPYLVAATVAAAGVTAGSTVLDVGTGSGYQAAVLARLARRVVSVGIAPEAAAAARGRLAALGCGNVAVVAGDGTVAEGPFDAIVVAAATPVDPAPLLERLAPGARLVMPAGGRGAEELVVIERTAAGWHRTALALARFAPLTGSFGR